MDENSDLSSFKFFFFFAFAFFFFFFFFFSPSSSRTSDRKARKRSNKKSQRFAFEVFFSMKIISGLMNWSSFLFCFCEGQKCHNQARTVMARVSFGATVHTETSYLWTIMIFLLLSHTKDGQPHRTSEINSGWVAGLFRNRPSSWNARRIYQGEIPIGK